jgi:hypothetical protein
MSDASSAEKRFNPSTAPSPVEREVISALVRGGIVDKALHAADSRRSISGRPSHGKEVLPRIVISPNDGIEHVFIGLISVVGAASQDEFSTQLVRVGKKENAGVLEPAPEGIFSAEDCYFIDELVILMKSQGGVPVL